MPNSILPQDKDGQELYNSISSFFQTFGLGSLLRKCNAQKEKGVPVLDIFKYKLCNTIAITQVDKCHTAEFTGALDPPGEGHSLSNITNAELSAGIRSVHCMFN